MSNELALDDLPQERLASGGGWIHSRAFDLSFFLLSPLLGFALAASLPLHGVDLLVLSAANYLIGVPHYFASFAFFGDSENRAYARQRTLTFVGVPLLICVAVATLYLTRQQHWVHSVLFVWNVWHVASQSSGIVSLYRKLAGGRMEERPWAHRAIVSANATMAFWFLERFPPLWNLLVAVDPALPRLLRYASAAAALFFAIGYVRQVLRRGFGLSLAEAASLATALLLFTPFLWVEDANNATLSMLVGHFVQYLAIVWLLNHRKYASAPQQPAGQRLLAALGRSWRGVALYMLGAGALFALFEAGTRLLNVYVIFMVAFNALALTHFWLDGLIWAFRDPYIRRTVAPYLTVDAQRLR
jgi:hypothetical protein